VQPDLSIVAAFDRRGKHIYVGNGKGRMQVFALPEMTLKASFKVVQGSTSATAIKSIEFARRGE